MQKNPLKLFWGKFTTSYRWLKARCWLALAKVIRSYKCGSPAPFEDYLAEECWAGSHKSLLLKLNYRFPLCECRMAQTCWQYFLSHQFEFGFIRILPVPPLKSPLESVQPMSFFMLRKQGRKIDVQNLRPLAKTLWNMYDPFSKLLEMQICPYGSFYFSGTGQSLSPLGTKISEAANLILETSFSFTDVQLGDDGLRLSCFRSFAGMTEIDFCALLTIKQLILLQDWNGKFSSSLSMDLSFLYLKHDLHAYDLLFNAWKMIYR